MKKTNKKSATRKLIPAISMLTVSALMLSTATYAWFTMNKEVSVTGLTMTATTSDSLEVSLGKVAAADKAITIGAQPADTVDEISWTNNVNVGEYYSTIDKMIPASTTDCATMFKATDATNAGMSASTFEATAEATTLAKRANLVSDGELADGDTEANNGYYIDIPVYLRSSIVTTTSENKDVYCKMTITNKDGNTTDPLYKAVRVAFIADNTTTDGAVDATAKAATIWGVDDEYYTAGKAVSDTAARDTVTVNKTLDGTQDIGIALPTSATPGAFGHTNFIVRVWLEGESTSCYDANAGQDWKIQMNFALDPDDFA